MVYHDMTSYLKKNLVSSNTQRDYLDTLEDLDRLNLDTQDLDTLHLDSTSDENIWILSILKVILISNTCPRFFLLRQR